MTNEQRKTALVVFGAGASLEYGAPSTVRLTEMLRDAVHADDWMALSGGTDAYDIIATALAGYYHGGANFVSFEHIYHCAHELIHVDPPIFSTVNEYRPTLVPFVTPRFEIPSRALHALIGFMADRIFDIVAQACDQPTISLSRLGRFIAQMRANYCTRIYTTNYDDFVLQAAPDLFTGFASEPSPEAKRFDGNAFWARSHEDCVFHLHGGVHLGFPRARLDAPIGELFWYDDRRDAAEHSSYSGSGARRQDGSDLTLSAVVTGLDKLSRLQRRPFSYYYAALGQDALRADLIYVIGYGLGDVHLNTWLSEARSGSRKPPLVLVDHWPNGFRETAACNVEDPKLLQMWHGLRTAVGYEPHVDRHDHPGWILDANKSCAVWGSGFGAFLEADDVAIAVREDLGA